MKKILPVIVLAAGFGLNPAHAQPPPGCGDAVPNYPLVYVRQHRLDTPLSAPGKPTLGDGANWQGAYDAGGPNSHTESDLVLDGAVIYDCTTSAEICAAQDPRVSPDATKISFTVARGDKLEPSQTWDGPPTPPILFFTLKYELWVYDIASKTKVKIDDDGRMADWRSNSSIAFASSRAGTWPPSAIAGNDYPFIALQIYTADLTKE